MKKRFTEERTIGLMREADAGIAIKELCRQRGFPRRATTCSEARLAA